MYIDCNRLHQTKRCYYNHFPGINHSIILIFTPGTPCFINPYRDPVDKMSLISVRFYEMGGTLGFSADSLAEEDDLEGDRYLLIKAIQNDRSIRRFTVLLLVLVV